MATWKEKIKIALSKASEQRKVAIIARDTGIPKGTLYSFASRGYMGTESVKILEDWLTDHGYLETSPEAPIPKITEFGLDVSAMAEKVFGREACRQMFCLPSIYSRPEDDIEEYQGPHFSAARLATMLRIANEIKALDPNIEHDWEWQLKDALEEISTALRDIEDSVAQLVRLESELLEHKKGLQ